MPGMAAGDGAPARFVGRGRELEAILDATAAAAAGHSSTILLEGSSGMGASRLIDEALSRLGDTGAPGPPSAIIRADRLPAWRDAPYAPFRSALDAFLEGRAADEVLALLGPGAEILLPLLPHTAERLGHSLEAMHEKFGGMLEAFDHGAPPHGGIALGIDRWAALFAQQVNIREVMAFPKTSSGMDLMLDAPSAPEPEQYAELGLRYVGLPEKG